MNGNTITFFIGLAGIFGIVLIGYAYNDTDYIPSLIVESDSAYEVLYSFENGDRHEWIGSNHFQGFESSNDWSSHGSYSLMGNLIQQSTTYFEPEMTKIYLVKPRDFSQYKSIQVDVRHQSGDCDPGGGLFARIYVTGENMQMIAISDQYPIGDWSQTLILDLPDDLRDGLDAGALKEVTRLSVQFLPCDTSTGNIMVYIDNVRGYLQ